LQVLLERDFGRELGSEAAVAGRGLAFESRQRVFLMRLRMQEYRKLAAHRAIAELFHLLRGGAHDHPVALANLQPEQLVPDRAANQIDLHGGAC
jgi:hypothetical protein